MYSMEEKNTVGKLYIVATPIGNSRDMSPRGRQILEEVDMIAAEDTRRSMVLLGKLEIRNKLVSNHKFNEYGKAKYFIGEMLQGKSVAVITAAGTPCISDPGNELIKAAVEAGIPVIGVPGCCAAVTALSVSGFDLSSFLFYGFFPRENAERRRLLEDFRTQVAKSSGTGSEPVIASGMAVYDPASHSSVSEVFELADSRMYQNKKELKSSGGRDGEVNGS